MKLNRHGQAKVLDGAEIKAIRGALAKNYELIFCLGLYTAARIGELVQLEKGDIVEDWVTFRKRTTKTKKTRQVPLHPELKLPLQEHIAGLPPQVKWLFPAGNGGHVDADTFSHALHRACKRLGIVGVATHSMRRTALTRMYLQGVSLKTIQAVSGHSRLDQLQRYLDVPTEVLRDSVQGLRY